MHVQENVVVYAPNVYSKTITKHKKINSTILVSNKLNLIYWNTICEMHKLKNYFIVSTNTLKNYDHKQNYDVILLTSALFNQFLSHKMHNTYAWRRVIIDKPQTINGMDDWKDIIYKSMWFISKSPCDFYLKYRLKKRRNWVTQLLHQSDSKTYFGMQKFQELINFLSNTNIYSNDTNQIKILNETHPCNMNSNCSHKLHTKKMLDSFPKSIFQFDNKLTTSFRQYLDEKKELNLDTVICSICRNKPEYPVLEEQCGNIFCSKCLLQWLSKKNSCPLCRQSIHSKDLIYKVSEQDLKSVSKIPTRFDILKNLIMKYEKLLVFSKKNIILTDEINDLLKSKKSNCSPNYEQHEISRRDVTDNQKK